MANLNIAIQIAAQDQASGVIGRIQGALGDLGSKTRQGFAGLQTVVGGAMLGIGAGAIGALTGIGAAAFDVQGDVKQATDALIIGTGASGAALDMMSDSVVDLAGSTAGLGHEMGAIGGVMAELNTRTGLTGDMLEDTTGQFLEFTRLAGGDGVSNVQLVTRVMGDWGVQNEDTGKTLDMLFGAGQAFGIGVDDVAAKVVQFGAPMRQMGFSLEESIALFGKWEKEGVNSELAIGSLRIAAGKFARENIPLQDGLRDTMAAIQGATSESEALAIAMDVFGARAGPDMAAAIREGRFELDSAIEALRATEGGLEDAAERSLDFRDRFAVIMNQAKLAVLPLGDALADIAERVMPLVEQGFAVFQENVVPAIETAADVVQSFLGGLEEGMSPLNAFIEAIWDIAPPGVLEALINLRDNILPGLMEFFTNNIQPIIDTVTQFVSWQDVLLAVGVVVASVVLPALYGIVAAAAPVIAVGVALVGAIALARTAWQNDWLGIQTAVTSAITAFWPFLDQVKVLLNEFVITLLPLLKTAWLELQLVWTESIQPALAELWASLQSLFAEIGLGTGQTSGWDIALGVLKGTLDAIILVVQILTPVIRLYGETLSFIIDQVTSTINGLLAMKRGVEGIIGVVGSAIDRIRNFGESLSNLGGMVPDWLIPGSPTPFETGLQGISRALERMPDLPGVGSAAAASGSALAGAGAGLGAAGGGTTYQITIYANDEAGGQQAGQSFVEELRTRGLL